MGRRRRFALALVALLIATQATSAANPRSVRAVPPDIRYGYDAVGRLKGVTDLNGNSATYNYDAVGNVTSITNSPASTVSIWSFSPLGGAVGATVRINGTGFSATPSQNTVKFFNNKTATVTSASASLLVVTVPSGATTGVIKVTVSGSTATSADNFTVGTSTRRSPA
jgi:YD repeat-containing protein